MVAITVSSLTDAETNAKVLRALFQERFNPRVIHSPSLRQEVERALEYQERIESHIGKQESGVLRDRLDDTANRVGRLDCQHLSIGEATRCLPSRSPVAAGA